MSRTSHRTFRRSLLAAGGLALALLVSSLPVAAQGVQTGIVTGLVQSSDGVPLPGVTVTASSTALQGKRAAVSDVNGVFIIKGLPAGIYTLDFELSQFEPAKSENVSLTVGGTAEVNASMKLAARTETVTVTAETSGPLVSTTTSQAFKKEDIDVLPVGRTPPQIAELAPGLTNNTPNNGQVTIGGATAFDNVFMLNGVDINDNLFGSPHNLFIEDAIAETNVLVGGISAEWGRFSGGVINMVTKSGGNSFSGSFRENLSKPSWISRTPREVANGITHSTVLSKTSEGTFGGPLIRDRAWFFTAGRHESSDTPITFVQTNGADTRHDINKRGEIKFTGSPANGHTISGDYTNNSTEQNNIFSLNSNSMDKNTLVNRQLPNNLFVANYNGVLGNKYFANVQYSQKHFGFRNAGGTSTAIKDSPFRTRGLKPGVPGTVALLYNAPFFSALDPEDRNNHQISGSVSETISTKSIGTHDIKAGAEYYVSTRTGGNAQSATNYVFLTDYVVQNNAPLLDSRGVAVPIFESGHTQVQNWIATVGAQLDIKTTSLYVQDKWVVGPRVTVDLGTRFEAVRNKATGDIIAVDTNRIVPRLGLAFDLDNRGGTVLQATYGHYSGKYSEGQFGNSTDVGTPSRITYAYTGPNGQGMDFAPGFDLANYPTVVSGSFPTKNKSFAEGTQSPLVKEFTLGLGRELGQKGFAKATYAWRTWSGFLEDEINLSNGIVNVTPAPGLLTRVVYDNTDSVKRKFQELLLQNGYRFRTNLSIGAHYTLQIKNEGNSNVEAANQPGIVSLFGDFPEIYGPAIDRYLPYGRLADYQRHKLRVYGTYSHEFGRFGAVDLSPLWRVNSGQVYSLSAGSVALSSIMLARNPGYPANDINANVSNTIFFGERGAEDFKGYGVLDFAGTYSIPVWRTVKPWIKFEVYNALNNRKQIAWDTTITAVTGLNAPVDANGLPTTYTQSARFGTAQNDNQFAQPIPGTNGGRLFRMAMGIRF
jgi:Carboxypeptidase regulatory-like domain